MDRIFSRNDNPTEHFASDREVLNFPAGGVFGAQGDVTSAEELGDAMLRKLDQMQEELDGLAEEMDSVLRFPGLDEQPRSAQSSFDDFFPPAA